MLRDLADDTKTATAPGTSAGREKAPVYADALDVANTLTPDGPVFCYSAQALERQTHMFMAGFSGEVTYAVKANPSPEIIRTLSRQGMTTFDVASPAEMTLVRTEAPEAGLHYHNPVKSRDEIAQAYHRFGIRHFAADDEAELHKLASTIADRSAVEAVIRFRSGKNRAMHDFSTKFGAEPDHAAGLLKLADDLGFELALTFHPGSQCLDARSYVENIEAAGEICRKAGLKIGRLNVGGGFSRWPIRARRFPRLPSSSPPSQTRRSGCLEKNTRPWSPNPAGRWLPAARPCWRGSSTAARIMTTCSSMTVSTAPSWN